jgi:hypothetical protein
MKIKIDMSDLKQTLDNCLKDTEQLTKMIEEYNKKYPFVKLTANIDVDYQKALSGIKYEIVTEVKTTDVKEVTDKLARKFEHQTRLKGVMY